MVAASTPKLASIIGTSSRTAGLWGTSVGVLIAVAVGDAPGSSMAVLGNDVVGLTPGSLWMQVSKGSLMLRLGWKLRGFK